MKIPDETYYKQGQKKIEDTRGWMLCTHCTHCALTHTNQIYTDGFFYCFYRNEWKEGDDLLEFMCDGYKQKRCCNCWNKRRCNDWRYNVSFCNKYQCRGKDIALRSISGRRRPLRTDRVAALEAEQMYLDIKAEVYAKDNIKEASLLLSHNQGNRV